VSAEIPETAAIVAVDPRGVPTRITNLRDLENELAQPPPQAHVPCPAGYSHAAPDTRVPYMTGKGSLPPQGETDE
jgi:hypothetical protein